MFCTAVGLVVGYVSYLLAGLVLLMIYGEDGNLVILGSFLCTSCWLAHLVFLELEDFRWV
jgi:hypothetical protein